jgi:hypothetical protein
MLMVREIEKGITDVYNYSIYLVTSVNNYFSF